MYVVLVATDFSVAAGLAVERAARLASENEAQLHLIHVFNDSAWQSLVSNFDLARLAGLDPVRSVRCHLETLSTMTQQKFGVEVTSAVLIGRASHEILNYANRHAVRLVVLGIRGENLFMEMTVGGTVLKVLERTTCGVLVVRRCPEERYATAIVATDFSATAHRALNLARALFPPETLHLAHAFQLPFEGRLRLADVSEAHLANYRESSQRQAFERLRSVACASIPDDRLHAIAGHPAAALLDLVTDLDANLIVIGRQSGHVAMSRLLGSVTQNIVHRGTADVLVVP